MKFTKMHGCGNDYVYVNCFEEQVPDPEKTAILVSDRHFGIGADGLILIRPTDKADFEMEMYNADGSRGAMCGNGIRCVAKYVYDHGMTDRTQITVNTGSGVKTLDLTVKDGKVESVRVNMGTPELTASRIPVISDTEKAIEAPILADGRDWKFTAVSMGNPHAVVFVESLDRLQLEVTGPKFENHSIFPDRVNTEFVKVVDESTIQMRVWERGSGETLACGTGSCAAAVAAILTGKVSGNTVTVELRGGRLQVEWDREANTVYMTGPATTVFEGEINI